MFITFLMPINKFGGEKPVFYSTDSSIHFSAIAVGFNLTGRNIRGLPWLGWILHNCTKEYGRTNQCDPPPLFLVVSACCSLTQKMQSFFVDCWWRLNSPQLVKVICHGIHEYCLCLQHVVTCRYFVWLKVHMYSWHFFHVTMAILLSMLPKYIQWSI